MTWKLNSMDFEWNIMRNIYSTMKFDQTSLVDMRDIEKETRNGSIYVAIIIQKLLASME